MLRKAFEWFDKKVAEQIKSAVSNRGMRLAQLMKDISDRLFFTVITVTDELNLQSIRDVDAAFRTAFSEKCLRTTQTRIKRGWPIKPQPSGALLR